MSSLKQQLHHFWSISWLRRSIISAIIMLIIVTIIPIAAQFSIQHLIEKQGADSAKIQDIDINPFTGTFELDTLTFSKSGYMPGKIQYLSGNLNMLDLLSSQIVFSDIQLSGVQLAVEKNEKNEVSLNGLLLVKNSSTQKAPLEEDSEASKPLDFALIRLGLNDIEVDYTEPDFNRNVMISELLLNDLISWKPEQPAKLNLKGNINETPLSVSAELRLFDVIKRINGTASLKALGFGPFAKFYRQYIQSMEGDISVESSFEISLSENLTARLKKAVELNNLKATYQNIDHRSDKILWNGVTELLEDGAVNIRGDLTVDGTQTRDNQQNYEIASFNQLSLKEIQYQSQEVSLGELSLDKLSLIDIKDSTNFVKVDNLNLKKFKFSPQSAALTIASIELKKPQVDVMITDQKQISFLLPLQNTLDALAGPQKEAQDEAASESKAPPLTMHIDNLTLSEPGMVHFSDNSVKPNYKTQLTLNKINLDNISSVEPSVFNLAIQQSEYTSINIEGKGLLLDPTGNIALKAKIKQLDLPPVTPYTSQAMGYGMKSGVVDSDIDLKIIKREIDSVVDLKIDSIEVVETDQKTAEQVSSASGMSIDLAISTLKDKNNVIELKLPVKGNLDQPDFDLSLILNKAMGKAMKSASLTYLKHTLQPFGSLVTLFSLAKAAAEHISLPPILFQTNSIELVEQQQDLLDKILKVLEERPGLKIKACGISALADQEAIHTLLLAEEKARLDAIAKKNGQKEKDGQKTEVKAPAEIVIDEAIIQQKMRDLADQRAAKVKDFFLEQGQLDANRILNCLSSSQLEADSKPSVEMQL